MLFSYVIKTPTYLETVEAFKIIEKEEMDAKFSAEKGKKMAMTTAQGKLKKLKELRDNDLISEQDYEEMKKEILSHMI